MTFGSCEVTMRMRTTNANERLLKSHENNGGYDDDGCRYGCNCDQKKSGNVTPVPTLSTNKRCVVLRFFGLRLQVSRFTIR